MAGLMEVDQKGKRQEISDIVFNIRADETPFTSMLHKDPKPHQKTAIYQVETYRKPNINGTMDGADVDTFNNEPREEVTALAQWFREPWKVSRFSDRTDVAGLPTGEKGHQKVVAAKVLKHAMEGRFLSAEECSTDNGTDTPNETRGAFTWVQNGAQDPYPVPASFRPGSSNFYSSTVALFTEAAFEAMLENAYTEKKGKLDLDGFVGIKLKRQMDTWTARDDSASASSVPIRTFNQDASNRRLLKVVDVFEFSTGVVRVHPSTFLYLSAAGADQAQTHRSGLFLDMDMWALAFNDKPRMVELHDLGGGPRGYSDAIAILKCFNPLAQCSAICAS